MKQHHYSKPEHIPQWETADSYILPDGTETSVKPESMTHLVDNILVYKDDPRIILRGKLDAFQSEMLIIINRFKKLNASSELITQLKEILAYTRIILGCEVMSTPIEKNTLLGWTNDEIRDRSHHPHKYFGLEQMILLDESYNEIVLALNLLRANVREIEINAVQAFRKDDEISRNDIVLALNRMGSCFHILMYQEIAKM